MKKIFLTNITKLLIVFLGVSLILVSCKSTPKTVEQIAVKPKEKTTNIRVRVPANTAGVSHKVYWGNSLRKLSKRYYGTERRWRRIYQANRLQIEDPDLIIGGQTLIIPR